MDRNYTLDQILGLYKQFQLSFCNILYEEMQIVTMVTQRKSLYFIISNIENKIYEDVAYILAWFWVWLSLLHVLLKHLFMVYLLF